MDKTSNKKNKRKTIIELTVNSKKYILKNHKLVKVLRSQKSLKILKNKTIFFKKCCNTKLKNFINKKFKFCLVKRKHKFQSFSYVLISILIGSINGFFGGGAGLMCVPYLMKFEKLKQKKAQATTMLVILPLSIVSAFVYFFNNNIVAHTDTIVYVVLSVVVGGVIGAVILNKISNAFLKILFSILLIISGFKML